LENASSTKWRPKPIAAAKAMLKPVSYNVTKIPSGGRVNIKAREVLTQADLTKISGVTFSYL